MEARMLQIALNAAPASLSALAEAKSEAEVFAHLPQAASSSFHLGLYEDAKAHADRALSMAPTFEREWSYGNALHLGHTILGLLALREDDQVSIPRQSRGPY
jgi:hypothetical protein